MEDGKKPEQPGQSVDVKEATRDWHEILRVSAGVDAVRVDAGSLLKLGGELVIKREGVHTVVALQSGHHREVEKNLAVDKK